MQHRKISKCSRHKVTYSDTVVAELLVQILYNADFFFFFTELFPLRYFLQYIVILSLVKYLHLPYHSTLFLSHLCDLSGHGIQIESLFVNPSQPCWFVALLKRAISLPCEVQYLNNCLPCNFWLRKLIWCSYPVRLSWDGQADPQGELLFLAAGTPFPLTLTPHEPEWRTQALGLYGWFPLLRGAHLSALLSPGTSLLGGTHLMSRAMSRPWKALKALVSTTTRGSTTKYAANAISTL